LKELACKLWIFHANYLLEVRYNKRKFLFKELPL
jgi:hypothetical protein